MIKKSGSYSRLMRRRFLMHEVPLYRDAADMDQCRYETPCLSLVLHSLALNYLAFNCTEPTQCR